MAVPSKGREGYSFILPMKKLLTRMSAVPAVVGGAMLPFIVRAQTSGNPFERANELAGSVGTEAGISSQRTLPEIIGQIINIILGFLGIVLLLLILYAGFLWMTAAGDDDKVGKARRIIADSVIGLVIIVAAFAISNFVLGALVDVTQ
jgi:hypothetical protein